MPKEYRCEIEVRGYELDSYGHVNHAVYISYLEHARWKLLQDEGFRAQSFAEWKAWPVIAGIEASYLKPCFLGDRLEVRSKLAESRRTGFSVDQEIFREGEPVVRAKVRVVTVDGNGRPTALPQGFAARLGGGA